MAERFGLSERERRSLGEVARWGVLCGFAGREPNPAELPEPPEGSLRRKMGSFVTLTLDGGLRGCIGTIVPHEPLYCNVARMAHAAAFQDPRFPPLAHAEWERTRMEISVLSPMQTCPDPEQIEVGRHGLVLRLGGHTGVFLPKVPVEQGWDRTAYLENLCRKAGLPGGSWRDPQAELYWYEAFVFSVETAFRARRP